MDISEVFKALGDPARLKIVSMIAEAGELCVCKIVDELDVGQPAVSHHLAKLRYAGLIRGRKEGQWVHYSLVPEALDEGPLAFLKSLSAAAKAGAVKNGDCC